MEKQNKPSNKTGEGKSAARKNSKYSETDATKSLKEQGSEHDSNHQKSIKRSPSAEKESERGGRREKTKATRR